MEDHKNLIRDIRKCIKTLKRQNAIPGLKYEDVSYWNNFVSISAISVSTLLSFLESVGTQFRVVDSKDGFLFHSFALLPVGLSTYVALSMAVGRFMKWSDKMEDISKISEGFSFVINKLRKTVKTLESINILIPLPMKSTCS